MIVIILSLAGSELPFEQTFLLSPAFGERVGDADREISIEEELGEVGDEPSPKRKPVLLDKD